MLMTDMANTFKDVI